MPTTTATGRVPALAVIAWVSAAAVILVGLTLSASHAIDVASRAIEGRLTFGAPIVLDGLAVAGSSRLIDDRRSGRRSDPTAYIATGLGLAGSMAANVVAVVPTVATDRQVQIAVAVIPPVAVGLLVHLGLLFLADGRTAVPEVDPVPSPVRRPVPGPRPGPTPLSAALAADLDRGRPALVGPSAPVPAVRTDRTGDSPEASFPTDDELLTAVRRIAEAEGRCPGRDAVARQLRAEGMSVATGRIGAIVKAVKAEAEQAAA